MGNSVDKDVHKDFADRYEFKQAYDDIRYGQIAIYKEGGKQKSFVALKEKIANNQASYLELRNKIFKRAQVINKFKGDIVFKYDRKFEEVCSSFYKFFIYHEWFEKTLEDHIFAQKELIEKQRESHEKNTSIIEQPKF